MLDNQTLDQLRRLRLSGMAAAFAQQLEQPQLQALSFEERFSLLLDRELTQRENRRLNRLLQLTRLRQQACVEDIDYKLRRGLERSLMAALITCDWSAPITTSILPDQPAPVNPGLPAPSVSRLAARVLRCAMSGWPVCSILCASPAVMALISNGSPPWPKPTC